MNLFPIRLPERGQYPFGTQVPAQTPDPDRIRARRQPTSLGPAGGSEDGVLGRV